MKDRTPETRVKQAKKALKMNKLYRMSFNKISEYFSEQGEAPCAAAISSDVRILKALGEKEMLKQLRQLKKNKMGLREGATVEKMRSPEFKFQDVFNQFMGISV